MQARESRPRRPRVPRQADSRSALLAALRRADAPMSVEGAAAAIGTTASTARFHLSMLVSAGQVVRAPLRSGSAGRPSWRYAVPPPAPSEPPVPPVSEPPRVAPSQPEPAPGTPRTPAPGGYQELARVLAAQLGGEAGAAEAARDAGRRWADTVSPDPPPPGTGRADAVAALVAVLDRLGFAPAPPLGGDEVLLRACPFEVVAREHRAVVCGVHLGLVERTAAALGGNLAVDGLEPFRTEAPLVCAVRLRPAG